MSRKFRLTGLQLGSDLQNLDIYHTSITASNLLVSDITASLLASTGIVVEVDDNVTTFIARAKDGDCNNRSGSLNIGVFEIEKMLQWGTPKDLEEYFIEEIYHNE